jgi:serine/threonine protein phosphatase PrpC
MKQLDPRLSASTAAAIRKPRDDEIDIYGLTHPGLVRPDNEDHFLVCALNRRVAVVATSLPDASRLSSAGERQAFLAMVADGVGGRAMGQEASRLAVERATEYVAASLRCYHAASDPGDDGAFAEALEAAAMHTHADIVRQAAADPALRGMATTLTLWLGVWPRSYLLQVGDSRCYTLRDDQLIQISRDQTMAQDLVDVGVLSRTDATRSRWSHVLSSAIGGGAATPVVTRIDQDWDQVGLLCSDGLTKHVPDKRLRKRLRQMKSARQACEALLEDALDDGGTDNITIVVGRAVRRDR